MNSGERRLIDPANGFERTYHSVRDRVEYSLVRVPPGCDFRVGFNIPSLNISMELRLQDPSSIDWSVTGTFDPDIFANLGFKVDAYRRKDVPPVVTVENLAEARAFGSLEEAGTSEAGLALYEAELLLPPFRVKNFFRSVWVPGGNLAYRHSIIPGIRIGFRTDEVRDLPQEIRKDRGIVITSLLVFSS